MTYTLNQNQKNLITSYKLADILNFFGVSNDEICKKNGLELEKFNEALTGKAKFSKTALKAIQLAITAEIEELATFADEPQVHYDINGYEKEEDCEMKNN